METTETKSAVQTAAKETAESARKVGDKLRTLAGSAADSSRRWAKRCGEALSGGARIATLQANQRVLRARMDRAYRELGRAVYAAQEKGEQPSALADSPELQAAMHQVKEAEANLDANGAKLAELRKSGGGEGSTSSS
jgi:hypothetical protein